MGEELASDQPLRPFRRGAKVVAFVGLALVAIGIVWKVSVPSNDGFMEGEISIDDVSHNNEADFQATSLIMLGAFLSLAGAGYLVTSSRSARRASYAVITEVASAATAGVVGTVEPRRDVGTVEQRLDRLEQLRASRRISDDEYRAKRGEILSQL